MMFFYNPAGIKRIFKGGARTTLYHPDKGPLGPESAIVTFQFMLICRGYYEDIRIALIGQGISCLGATLRAFEADNHIGGL